MEDLGVKDPKVVVDLGGWIGTSPCWFASYFKNSTVFTLEPDIDNYKEIISTMLKFNIGNVIPILSAIGEKNGTEEMKLLGKSFSHTLVEEKRIDNKWYINRRDLVGKRIVPTINWDTLVDTLNITEVDFAKVNIEGSEIGFLKGMTKVFPKRMILEEHSRCGMYDGYRKDLDRLVKEHGYKIIKERLCDLYLIHESEISKI